MIPVELKKDFFLFPPFLFLLHSLVLLYLNGYNLKHTTIKTKTQSKDLKHKNNFSHKPYEIRTIERKREGAGEKCSRDN